MLDDKHGKAVDLTDKALASLVHGDEKKADKLIAHAKTLDPRAPEEVVRDLKMMLEGLERPNALGGPAPGASSPNLFKAPLLGAARV
jgi:hypothetical protein